MGDPIPGKGRVVKRAEGVTARSDLQKIRYSLRENANVLSSVLVDFRRLIRAVHGSTSKGYHSIEAFYGRNPEVTDEPVEISYSEDQSTQDGPSSDMQPAGPGGSHPRP